MAKLGLNDVIVDALTLNGAVSMLSPERENRPYQAAPLIDYVNVVSLSNLCEAIVTSNNILILEKYSDAWLSQAKTFCPILLEILCPIVVDDRTLHRIEQRSDAMFKTIMKSFEYWMLTSWETPVWLEFDGERFRNHNVLLHVAQALTASYGNQYIIHKDPTVQEHRSEWDIKYHNEESGTSSLDVLTHGALFYDNLSQELNCAYLPHPLRSSLSAFLIAFNGSHKRSSAYVAMRFMEKYRQSLAADVNARKVGPIYDLRVPAVFGMIVHNAKSTYDIIPLALKIRKSKEALDFRKWALRRTHSLQNGDLKAMLAFLSEMQGLADKLALDLGIKSDKTMLNIAVDGLHVAFLQNLFEVLISTSSIIPDIKRVFGVDLFSLQDRDRLAFLDQWSSMHASLEHHGQGSFPDLFAGKEVSELLQKKRDIAQEVLEIINRFKFEVEVQRLWKNLWYKDDPISEVKAHNLLYVSACRNAETLNIDISPETETGRGLIDFKLSAGHAERVHVELKYFHSRKIVQGLHQLATYLRSERVDMGFYVIIDFGIFDKSPHKKWSIEERIQKAKEDIEKKGHIQIFVIYIDARKKQSASKIESPKSSRPRLVSQNAGRKEPGKGLEHVSIQKAEEIVVELMEESKKPMTLPEIAKKTGLPEAKVFRVLRKMFEQGNVNSENRRYMFVKCD